jgi:hypothetical protein
MTGHRYKYDHITEALITEQIRGWLHRAKAGGMNLWWMKIHGSNWQKSGVPDWLILRDGRYVWIEVKTPRGAVRPIQAYQIGQLEKCGADVWIVRSLEEFVDVMERFYGP